MIQHGSSFVRSDSVSTEKRFPRDRSISHCLTDPIYDRLAYNRPVSFGSDASANRGTHVISVLPRSAAHGVLGAMAMTGMRRVTRDLGLVRKPPPERIADEGIPALFARIAPEHRETAIEFFHWGVGAAGGIGFGILPAPLRRRRWAGPAYGLAMLSFFETAIAPRLGIAAKDPSFSERLALAADHVLYGIVLGDKHDRGLRS